MAAKLSQKVMNKKEALRCDSVVVNRKDFCFPNKKVNKAVMYMSKDSKQLQAKDADITVDYYNNDKLVIRCVMQPCGDIYVTDYNDNQNSKQTICVNPNCKEGILLTDYSMESLLANDKRTQFAKRVSSQSMILWKDYVDGKHLTGLEMRKLSAYKTQDVRK
jgi:hypothetical protein